MSERNMTSCWKMGAGIVLTWLFAIVGAGCGESPSGAGPGVGEPGGAERIVALSPAVAVMLRDLGVADRVVGRHDYDLVLSPDVPAVGHQEAIDYEALLTVRPTHVLIEWGSRPLPPRLGELAERHGWAVVRVRLLTLDDIARTVDDLAIMFGVVDPFGAGDRRPPGMDTPRGVGGMPRFVDPVTRLEQTLPSARLARAWQRRGEGFEGVGGVLLLGSVDPPGVLGPGSFHHQILERIGGVPAIAEGSPWIELDVEDIHRLAPGAIVLIAPRAGGGVDPVSVEEIRRRLGRIGGLDIPAVRDGRLGLIDDPLALTPSTAMAGFADELAGMLAGWVE